MVDGQEKYLGLLLERDLLHALEGFSEEREDAFIEACDVLWRQMTIEEQQELELLLSRVPSAPVSLGLVDRVVVGGGVPREPAHG